MKRKIEKSEIDSCMTSCKASMKNQVEDEEQRPTSSKLLKQKKVQGSIFNRVNIYTLKYLVQNNPEPAELREKLLKYTKLNQPYCQDIQIESEFLTNEEIQIDLGEGSNNTPAIKYLSSSKQHIDIETISCFEDISDEQYGNVILKIFEVLGITLEQKVRNVLNEFKMSPSLLQSLTNMLELKTKYFNILIYRTYEDKEDDDEEEKYSKTLFPDQDIFNSLFDETIHQIYCLYKGVFFHPESKQNIQSSIDMISQIIDSALNQVSLAETTSTNIEGQQYILSYKEQSNLNQLKEVIQGSHEYFSEKLKPLLERQFFFWKEVVKVTDINPDMVAAFPMNTDSYFNEKYTEIIKNCICAIANSQGGVIFLGIHNTYYNELKKFAQQITPRVECDIKLLNVVNRFKFSLRDNNKNAFIISIHVKNRKPKDFFYLSRNSNEKWYYIRNHGFNLKLKPQQQKQLADQRSAESDVPNYLDYLQFSYYCKDIQTSQKQPQSNRVQNNCLTSPRKKNLSQIFEDTQENQNSSNLNIKRLNRINRMSTKPKPFNDHIENSGNRLISENMNRLRKNLNKFDNRTFSCDQKENNLKSNLFAGKGLQENIPKYFPIHKQSQIHLKEQFFSNPQICQLDNWKKQFLKEFLYYGGTQTYQDFIESAIVQKLMPQFDQLTSKNCYIIYRIDSQYRVQFKDAVALAFTDNQIEYQYVGNIQNFTILNVDREKYHHKIERVITPISVNYSFRNKVIQGFNFDCFEIKYAFKVHETINILEQLFNYLGVDFNIKYTQGKLLVYFTKIQAFIFGYFTFLKIKQVFEMDQYSSKVFQGFNQANKV